MVQRTPVRKPSIQADLPQSPGSATLGKGQRFSPNYSLNNIEVNPNNPRKKQLDKMGLTLKTVKQLRRKPNEQRDEFEQRISHWIASNESLTAEQREKWESFLNVALSILDDSLLQPIAIRQPRSSGGIATLIAGERRYLAHWLIGASTIAANIKNVSDGEASMLTLLENFQREEIDLEGTIHGIRDFEHEFGKQHSLMQLARILNISKSSAQGVRWTIDADDDDPVFEELSNGTLTKPYHLAKHFQDRKKTKAPSAPVDRPNLDDGNAGYGVEERSDQDENRPNLDDGNAGYGVEERSNQDENRPNLDGEDSSSASMKTGETSVDRPNLDDSFTSTQDGEALHREVNRPNLDDNQGPVTPNHNVERSADRPNLDGAPKASSETGEGETRPYRPNLDDMEDTKNLLAAVCLDMLNLNNSDYEPIAEKIDAADSANEVLDVVKVMAAIHREAES